MASTIHIFVEKKTNGKWISIDKWNTEDEDEIYVEYEDKIYKGNYHSTFALLADVSNYQEIEPISQPKGLPSNASIEVQKASRYWGEDGHSRSYFTLKELLEFDWEKPIIEAGYIDNRQWKLFYKSMKTDHPDYKLRNTHSQGIDESMRKSFTWHKWEIPAKFAADDFYDTVIPKLSKLGIPEEVRIVFFFDN